MTEKPTPKYRKAYQPPTHFIASTDLTFDLHEDYTHVYSKLAIVANSDNFDNSLRLDGKDLSLLSIKLDGALLNEPEYELTSEALVIHQVPKQFTLEIETQIDPKHNTELLGLYRSNGTFCTQCEAEGFRKITYYLDRPDVLASFTTTIIADQDQYPVLLSNGNLIDKGELEGNRHFVKWHDPFKKPSYLFALVAGDLGCLEDQFVTGSGREVALKIFAAHQAIDKCHYAMEALKKSMRWDEEVYGREYDLDVFMVVAINDFNFGAMENKGLNIFNDKFILVNPTTATDIDYSNIDRVVGHEYFHNWSGNRVTLRDWFQICLKEGFTVFREQSFCESVGLKMIERINHVELLRSIQFPEDGGPLAHPIRPDSYIEMNNFYTITVYEKGSEVIRMLHTILGAEKFRAGSDLYFERNDGQAVTCDDFVQAMEDASDIDLSQFKHWYSQAGTPEVTVKTAYDEQSCQYTITLEQSCPATPGQPDKPLFHIPVAVGLLDQEGQDMTLQLAGEQATSKTAVLNLKEQKQQFCLTHIMEKPTPSLLRYFSAPVRLHYDYSEEELAFLMANDNDPVARWEAGQKLALLTLDSLIKQYQNNEPLAQPIRFLNSLGCLLKDEQVDEALKAKMLNLPSEDYLLQFHPGVKVEALVAAREFLQNTLGSHFNDSFAAMYHNYNDGERYQYTNKAAAKRLLKNTCLYYLAYEGNEQGYQLCYEQFKAADNMTDQYAALRALSLSNSSYWDKALAEFFEQWQGEPLVMDKWFAVQAGAKAPDLLTKVKTLLNHSQFSVKNPNKVRALLGMFARNFKYFHAQDGKGYNFIADQVIILDKINCMVAAKLASYLAQWRQFDPQRRDLMKAELKRIINLPDLSNDVYEIVSKSLNKGES